ncbi:MFS transporter [Acidicapsa ligni]|uniref:MFS transporter n=1 Tax=Acidicapsa ligni TaxID=542300 RepID=UPI0021E043E0|nr:MFS transporter [Acidicapsa ligni]
MQWMKKSRPASDASSITSSADLISPRWGFAVSSGVLGWVLDAFDFFVLVFLVDVLAANFHVEKSAIVWTITITLAMRPVGALLLGSLADRFGRRRPLIACVLYFSIITALTPFAPNYTAFIILRALYGIGMGGYWGIGASLVMESSPTRWRGLFSGVLQSGYSLGYLLAAVALRTIEPHFGWRWMFLCGLAFACIITVLTLLAPESQSWEKHRLVNFGEVFQVLWQHRKDFAYLVLMMTAITCLSHGTQDLYPDFLKTVHRYSNSVISNIAILYNIGAIMGALVIGHYSDRLGRRNAIFLALIIASISIPLWAFGSSIIMLAIGSFVMQFGVQGAFGVIPAHLNELSPNSVRSLFPGIVYQLGVLIGAPSVVIEFTLRKHLGYQWALTVFEICVITALSLIFGFGPERKGRDFAG